MPRCSKAGANQHPRATVAHDIKAFIRRLQDSPYLTHDAMLYGFLLSADPSSSDLASLAEKYLDQTLDADPASHADAILGLYQRLRPEMESFGLAELYETVELPLVRVLAKMEETGIRVDPDQFRRMSGRMEEELARLSAEIYESAGKPFNINSPQQLSKVLFDDLNLPAPFKAGKGKVVSTAADGLETLSEEREIARKVLDYRQLAKVRERTSMPCRR